MIEYITPQQAQQLHKDKGYGYRSIFTIISWIKLYNLGKKIGGRWQIDKSKFIEFLEKGTYLPTENP